MDSSRAQSVPQPLLSEGSAQNPGRSETTARVTKYSKDKEQSKVKIDIEISEGVVIPVTIDKDSGFLYEEYRSTNGRDIVNLQLFLESTEDVSYNTYIYFLRGKYTPIADRNTMSGCLSVYLLTDDRNFFDYILGELFRLWSILSPVLSSLKVPTGVKRDIWLYCPYQLLPDDYLEDDDFMTDWSAIQENKAVTINDNETLEYRKKTKSLILTNGDKFHEENVVSYKRETDSLKIVSGDSITFGRDGNVVINTRTSYNDKTQGVSAVAFPPVVVRHISLNGSANGLETRLVDGRLTKRVYYLDNKYEGPWIEYYPDGRVSKEIMFRNGQREEVVGEWYDDV